MLRLVGGTHYLVLRRSKDLRSHSVAVYRRFEQAIEHWQIGDRISPIFSLNSAGPPNLVLDSRTWILLLGPIHPGDVDETLSDRMFLSLGVFNLIVFASSEAQRDAAIALAEDHAVEWEQWTLLGDQISDVAFPDRERPDLPASLAEPISLAEGLEPSVREYRALMLTCVTRAQRFTPDLVGDLIQFDSIFRKALQNPQTDGVVKLGSLVIANAALSRLSSQAYSGTSPIKETEAHFWTHSLLGIGIASIALIRIRRFIDEAMVRSHLTDRLLALKDVNPADRPLQSLSSRDKFWERDHLFRADDEELAPQAEIPQDYLPLISFFSGRDGFRSTELSLSAPLELVSNCNSTRWTIQTVTHEISHVIIEATLARLLPRPDDLVAIEEVVRSFEYDHQFRNLFQQVRALLCFGICQISARHDITEEKINADRLSEYMGERWSELREILTHVFDFLYFYGKDAPSYIRAVWVSWDVIPNIQNRIKEYLTRSLCALHANNLRRGSEGLTITVDQLLSCLKDVRQDFEVSNYMPHAIAELEQNRQYYEQRLQKRVQFVRFVRYFLYSPKIERLLLREPLLISGDSGSYDLPRLEFSDRRPVNPLRFIAEFSDDKKGDYSKSAWMLTQLAFIRK